MGMTNEEFKKEYGRLPYKKKKKKIYWGRIIITVIVLALIIFGIVQAVRAVKNHSKGDKLANATTSQAQSSSSADDEFAGIDEMQFKVCLDPGHGDYDIGTASLDGKRIEKDDDLKLALKVRDCLEKHGVVVVMTRDDDSFLELDERCNFANNEKADFFVSIHRNSYDGDIYGVEAWVHNKKPPKDTALAQCIMDKLDKTKISDDRGVQYGYVGLPYDNYYINAETKMPSCLLEMGFLTNDTDNELFDKYIDNYAKAISNGIISAAMQLEVIDNSGKRILNEQLVSVEKDYKRKKDSSVIDESSVLDDDTSLVVYNEDEQEIYAE
ncbi:MAG: N-acetylmuramoyl-L-alanine amidase [Ruminococcus sp.]|nr:N-acetylmuramoyl-L-alanine amidase [Ruminococcus sp.]